MGVVYKGSVLNIAATGFADGQNELYNTQDHNLLIPIHVAVHAELLISDRNGYEDSIAPKGNYLLSDMSTWKDGADDSPLCQRGWVTQERALSIRTLHFGHRQLFWECLCGSFSKIYPLWLPHGTAMNTPKTFLSFHARKKKDSTQKLFDFRDRVQIRLWAEEAIMSRDIQLRMELDKTSLMDSAESLVSLSSDPLELDGCYLDLLDGCRIAGWDEFKCQMRNGCLKRNTRQNRTQSHPGHDY